MILQILRALFILVLAAVGWFFVRSDPKRLGQLGDFRWLALMISLSLGVFVVAIDILSSRKKLAIFSGTFFGLIVGTCIAFALSFVTPLLLDRINSSMSNEMQLSDDQRAALLQFINFLVGVIACYLSISFILQTKDDFRFIIPYVEFSKQTKGARPFLLDTNVLIDGRIVDIARTGLLESQLVVPRFIQDELRRLADSGDKMIRARGRRGLDVLTNLKALRQPEVIDYDSSAREDKTLMDEDVKLISLAKELNARVLTNDYNLNKIAQLRDIDVINLNELANAMKPEMMPGERMVVRIIKAGESSGQGVGYLDDGTMVVVEGARAHVENDVEFTVTNTRQTVQGKMIFGRIAEEHGATERDATSSPRQTPRPKKAPSV